MGKLHFVLVSRGVPTSHHRLFRPINETKSRDKKKEISTAAKKFLGSVKIDPPKQNPRSHVIVCVSRTNFEWVGDCSKMKLVVVNFAENCNKVTAHALAGGS